MLKLKTKLTTIIIILIGLFVTAPTLFADPNPEPTHRRRPEMRQEMRRGPRQGLNFPLFVKRILRRQMRRQARRNMRRQMNRWDWEHGNREYGQRNRGQNENHNCPHCNHGGNRG